MLPHWIGFQVWLRATREKSAAVFQVVCGEAFAGRARSHSVGVNLWERVSAREMTPHRCLRGQSLLPHQIGCYLAVITASLVMPAFSMEAMALATSP